MEEDEGAPGRTRYPVFGRARRSGALDTSELIHRRHRGSRLVRRARPVSARLLSVSPTAAAAVPPGSKWCARCEESKSKEEFKYSSNAVCAVCDYDYSQMCDTCAFDFISFCEGCNVCECTECPRGQAGWNHMYGPSGAVGISCARCKPWDYED